MRNDPAAKNLVFALKNLVFAPKNLVNAPMNLVNAPKHLVNAPKNLVFGAKIRRSARRLPSAMAAGYLLDPIVGFTVFII
jgi:hypothetical protein